MMWPLFGVDLAAHLIAAEMFSNYVSTETGQDQLTAARRNYLGVRCWPILLKNPKLMRVCFSAKSKNILNSVQHLMCKFTRSFVGRYRWLQVSPQQVRL
jgi:hypothetical protein